MCSTAIRPTPPPPQPAAGGAGAAHLFEIIQGDGVKRVVGQRHFLTSVCIDLTMCHFYDVGLHFHCGPLPACNLQITCFHLAEGVYWQGMRTSWHQASSTARIACIHSRWMDVDHCDYDNPAGATRQEEYRRNTEEICGWSKTGNEVHLLAGDLFKWEVMRRRRGRRKQGRTEADDCLWRGHAGRSQRKSFVFSTHLVFTITLSSSLQD